jgi:hypothetical protein
MEKEKPKDNTVKRPVDDSVIKAAKAAREKTVAGNKPIQK